MSWDGAWLARLRKKRVRIFERLFSATLGRLEYYRTWAPGIQVIPDAEKEIRGYLTEHLDTIPEGQTPVLLDVGGRKREREHLTGGYRYVALDIEPRAEGVLVGDICSCPQISDNTFDVVMSFDVFEHVERPWDAAEEAIRILKPGGLMIHRTLFAYRYHPCPIDYWRYTSDGLEYLFNRTGRMETLLKGYDLKIRRFDKRGMHPGDLDSKPPLDYLGGFRENWRTVYIGRKM